MLYQIFKSKHKTHITMSQTPNTCKEYSDIDYLIYIINWSHKMSLPPHILYLQYGFMFPYMVKIIFFPYMERIQEMPDIKVHMLENKDMCCKLHK